MAARYTNTPNTPEHIVRRRLNAARLEIETRLGSRHDDAAALVRDAIFAILTRTEPQDAGEPISAAQASRRRR